jgi:hypothetical protein
MDGAYGIQGNICNAVVVNPEGMRTFGIPTPRWEINGKVIPVLN